MVLLACVAAAVGATVMLGSTCALFNKAPTVPVISGPSAGVAGDFGDTILGDFGDTILNSLTDGDLRVN
jgi:hypothetical protein